MYVFSFLVSCVADNQNLNENYIFLYEKRTLFVLNLVPRTLDIAFKGFEISKFSDGVYPQTPPPRGTGLMPPVDTVGYSIKTC